MSEASKDLLVSPPSGSGHTEAGAPGLALALHTLTWGLLFLNLQSTAMPHTYLGLFHFQDLTVFSSLPQAFPIPH